MFDYFARWKRPWIAVFIFYIMNKWMYGNYWRLPMLCKGVYLKWARKEKSHNHASFIYIYMYVCIYIYIYVCIMQNIQHSIQSHKQTMWPYYIMSSKGNLCLFMIYLTDVMLGVLKIHNFWLKHLLGPNIYIYIYIFIYIIWDSWPTLYTYQIKIPIVIPDIADIVTTIPTVRTIRLLVDNVGASERKYIKHHYWLPNKHLWRGLAIKTIHHS